MISRLALAMAIAGLFASPAMAFHCPADAKAIDAAMSKVQLDETDRAQVQTLRDEGMALHEAGSHKEAVDKLSEAMRLLLNGL